MKIVRKLFVVPMADNDHGKSTMIRALVSQGLGEEIRLQKKGARELVSPQGRPVDAYVFGRSYQEVEKGKYGSVEGALDANDAQWRERELIIMPSHVEEVDQSDIQDMIDVGHSAGFDVIAASIILAWDDGGNQAQFPTIWGMAWDERWTIPNPWNDKPEGQLEALGRDLWTWICRGLVP